MNDFKFRLNPHTYVRNFSEYFYLENQVSHVHAKLPTDEFRWLSSVNHVSTYDTKKIYDRMPNHQRATEILQQLDKAWLIDIEGRAIPLKRRFSYANKSEIERCFKDFPEIGIATPDEKPHLRNLQLELTDACNERCIHCYLPNTKKDKCKALSKNQVINILHQYREMEGLKVVFSGGEILLHPQFFDIMEECKRLNLMILLQSNLLSLTEKTFRR